MFYYVSYFRFNVFWRVCTWVLLIRASHRNREANAKRERERERLCARERYGLGFLARGLYASEDSSVEFALLALLSCSCSSSSGSSLLLAAAIIFCHLSRQVANWIMYLRGLRAGLAQNLRVFLCMELGIMLGVAAGRFCCWWHLLLADWAAGGFAVGWLEISSLKQSLQYLACAE